MRSTSPDALAHPRAALPGPAVAASRPPLPVARPTLRSKGPRLWRPRSPQRSRLASPPARVGQVTEGVIGIAEFHVTTVTVGRAETPTPHCRPVGRLHKGRRQLIICRHWPHCDVALIPPWSRIGPHWTMGSRSRRTKRRARRSLLRPTGGHTGWRRLPAPWRFLCGQPAGWTNQAIGSSPAG